MRKPKRMSVDMVTMLPHRTDRMLFRLFTSVELARIDDRFGYVNDAQEFVDWWMQSQRGQRIS